MVDRGQAAAPVFGMRREIDRLIGDAFSRQSRDRRRVDWAPVAGVHEDDRELTVTLALPGISASDVQISAAHGVLTIRGEKHDARPGHGQSACSPVVERRDGSFSQSFPLPRGVDEGWIDARFEGAVLTVRVPKAAARHSPPIPRPDGAMAAVTLEVSR